MAAYIPRWFTVRGAALVTAAALGACAHGDSTPTAPNAPSTPDVAEAATGAFAKAPEMLSVPTYDLSGQSVHPDVVEFGAAWHGAPYWLTMTPYPDGRPAFENPSVLTSDDGTALDVPQGVMNPLVGAPGLPSYNSDPDLAYDAAFDRLVMSYRVVHDGLNTIMVTSSADGDAWDRPHIAFEEPAHSAVSQSMTPAVDGHPPMAWYVDAGPAGCGAAATRVMMRQGASDVARLDATDWSPSTQTVFDQAKRVIWHLKVRYVPAFHEYWAIYVAYAPGGTTCTDDDLFFARSSDGVVWTTYARPVLRHELRSWTAGALYRGSFLYDPSSDELRVWFSSRDQAGAWHMGYAAFHFSALIKQLSAPAHSRTPPDASNAPPVRTAHQVWTDWP